MSRSCRTPRKLKKRLKRHGFRLGRNSLGQIAWFAPGPAAPGDAVAGRGLGL